MSRYAQGVRFTDGVSLTQEEHYSMGIRFIVFYHSCAAPVVYCSISRSSKEEQVNAPHGVREVHTPRVGCVLGARTPHEFLSIIVRLDSSKMHLIRNRKTDPGWISYSRMSAFFPKISTYITTPETIIFRWISACLSCCYDGQPDELPGHHC